MAGCIIAGAVLVSGYSPGVLQRPVSEFESIEIPARPTFAGAANASHDLRTVIALRDELFDVAERLVQEIPKPDSLCLLGTVHHLHDNDGEAVKLWQQCLRIDPQFADAHHALGMRALAQGDFGEAEASLRAALRIDPGWYDVPLPLERALQSQGKFPEAVSVLESFVAAHPQAWEGWHRLGLAYQALDDHENAKRCHLQALTLKPDFTNAYHGAATAFKKLGQVAEAEPYAEKFHALMADDLRRERALRTDFGDENRTRERVVRTRLTAARVYLKHGRPEAAESQWQRVAELDPQDRECRESLCDLYTRQQRPVDALRVRMELSKLEPDNPRQLLSLGILQYQNRQLGDAEGTFRRVIVLAPQQAEGYAALAQVQMSPGRNADEAVELALQAVKRSPTAGNYFILAMAHESRGEPAATRQALEEAIRRDPAEARYREPMHGCKGRSGHELPNDALGTALASWRRVCHCRVGGSDVLVYEAIATRPSVVGVSAERRFVHRGAAHRGRSAWPSIGDTTHKCDRRFGCRFSAPRWR